MTIDRCVQSSIYRKGKAAAVARGFASRARTRQALHYVGWFSLYSEASLI